MWLLFPPSHVETTGAQIHAHDRETVLMLTQVAYMSARTYKPLECASRRTLEEYNADETRTLWVLHHWQIYADGWVMYSHWRFDLSRENATFVLLPARPYLIFWRTTFPRWLVKGI
jgi:hypothetical protein